MKDFGYDISDFYAIQPGQLQMEANIWADINWKLQRKLIKHIYFHRLEQSMEQCRTLKDWRKSVAVLMLNSSSILCQITRTYYFHFGIRMNYQIKYRCVILCLLDRTNMSGLLNLWIKSQAMRISMFGTPAKSITRQANDHHRATGLVISVSVHGHGMTNVKNTISINFYRNNPIWITGTINYQNYWYCIHQTITFKIYKFLFFIRKGIQK